jgi:hypothetical protein
MNYLKAASIICTLFLFRCTESNKPKTATDTIKTLRVQEMPDEKNSDKEEIQTLVRKMLSWSNSKDVIELLPVVTAGNEETVVGLDLRRHQSDLEKLKRTGYFSTEFIESFHQIILKLDEQTKKGKYDKWSLGELPPYNFASDASPWCNCQDVPYDTPDPYSQVEVYVTTLSKTTGALYWKWGKLAANVPKDWRDFSYQFKVSKEDGQWKIAYLQEFDFKKATGS